MKLFVCIVLLKWKLAPASALVLDGLTFLYDYFCQRISEVVEVGDFQVIVFFLF